MAPKNNGNLGGYWAYLVNPDKSATLQFEQLCLGLAKVIANLDPTAGNESQLTAQRLAAFYRSAGGNYDSLFLKSSDDGLSYMYKALGCFQNLLPGANPREYPTIPALTPSGFVEWQRIQLLLNPEEHGPILQEALRKYDVPRPDGGIFPKSLPREAWPEKPDEEMERWYRQMTGKLKEPARHIPRIQASPYQSPYEPPERGDGYFGPGRASQSQRPSRSPRLSSQEGGMARLETERRRSSVADISMTDGNGQWSNDGPHLSRPEPTRRSSRSTSAHGRSNPSQHRTSNASGQHRYSNTSHRPSNSSALYRSSNSPTDSPIYPPIQPPEKHHHRHTRHRSSSGRLYPRSPSTIDESSPSSDASSEKSEDERPDHRRSSLWPPSFLGGRQRSRRHSHDASYSKSERKPPLPPRRNQEPPPRARERQRKSESISPSANSSPVQFRSNVFDRNGRSGGPAPTSPADQGSVYQAWSPENRYYPGAASAANAHLLQDDTALYRQKSTSSSGSNANGMDQEGLRNSGRLTRTSTVSGVGGRKYPSVDLMSAGAGFDRERGKSMAVPMVRSG